MESRSSKKLSNADVRRIERFKKTRRNRRGRKAPARIPHRLTRTNAFAPTYRNLNTDSEFERLYIVPKYSVIRVSGRELGVGHRDITTGVFRHDYIAYEVPNPQYDKNAAWSRANQPSFQVFEVITTWRKLLEAMHLTPHTHNLMTLFGYFEDIKKVVFTVFEGNPDMLLQRGSDGKMQLKPDVLEQYEGHMGNLFGDIRWSGLNLDSELRIQYGSWVREMLEKSALVSHDAEVQFDLSSAFAKSIWPYIDSQPNYRWIDEDMICHLLDRDIWAEGETAQSRADFRRYCREAFEDMKAKFGLADFSISITGSGRKKSRRYHYTHNKLRQMDLGLDGV
ncbi:MAG: hypothetical protein NXH88_05660 [Hyphomonas sp.]|nr:hypothetical protein [Hyphomonas sp.]